MDNRSRSYLSISLDNDTSYKTYSDVEYFGIYVNKTSNTLDLKMYRKHKYITIELAHIESNELIKDIKSKVISL